MAKLLGLYVWFRKVINKCINTLPIKLTSALLTWDIFDTISCFCFAPWQEVIEFHFKNLSLEFANSLKNPNHIQCVWVWLSVLNSFVCNVLACQASLSGERVGKTQQWRL